MIDVQALKAEFVRNGMTQQEVAKEIGISPKTLSQKLKKGVFGTDEANKLVVLLDIKDPARIFFAKNVT